LRCCSLLDGQYGIDHEEAVVKKQGLGIAVVAVWMLVLALVVGDAASTTEPVATLVTPTMPSVADADAPTSTWLCAASSAAV
jgi:hypothetical protein